MSDIVTRIDQMKREVHLPAFPYRIVSLVPSQTELLYDLGLDNRVVGITKFCVHPESWFNGKQRVGGTKKVDFEKIRALQPDLIIGNKEENSQDDIEQLEKEFPVWMSDIETFDQALEMIQQIALITNVKKRGMELIQNIQQQKKGFVIPQSEERVLYFIWKDPWMAVGKNTFIDEMINISGRKNILKKKRYVTLTDKEIIELAPDCIFLSSEPYPFKDEHVNHFQKLLPDAKVLIVDGEMFSWYGSRLVKAFRYFKSMTHE